MKGTQQATRRKTSAEVAASRPEDSRAKDLLWIVGIVALCFAVYLPSLSGEFLWDDPAHVTRAELRSLDGLRRIFFEFGATQEYYPLLHGAFWVQYQLWGDTPWPYHATTVLLHATNCCLLAFLLRRLSAPWPQVGDGQALLPAGTAWTAALLFAVHPVSVESVAWITEQKNTLSTAFYLGSVFVYLRFARYRSRRAYGWAAFLFLLAVASKTMTVTLPAALLVVLWWKRGSLAWRRDAVPLLPWFGAALTAGLVTKWFEGTWVGADSVVTQITPWEHVLLAARIFWFSLGKLVWPTHLTFFYERWDVAAESGGWILHLGAAAAVTIAFWALRGRWRGPLAGWLLYAGTLFPVLGFFRVYSFAFAYVADHYQYLAVPIVITALAGAFRLVASLPQVPMRVAYGAGLMVLSVLAGYSFTLSRNYRDDETLFRANITSNPQSWMGHQILATAIQKTSPERREEVIALLRRALELNPGNPEPHYRLGSVLVRDPATHAEGLKHLREALRIRHAYPEALYSLAVELEAMPGHEPEAITLYENAVRLRPKFAYAHANLARLLCAIPERRAEAYEHFERALERMPGDPRANYFYARLLAATPGRELDAANHFMTSLVGQPSAAEAHAGLGTVLARVPGRFAEAELHLATAIRMQPEVAEFRTEYGNALAVAGRFADALPHFEAALRLAPQLAASHYNLANTLARLPGRSNEAIDHYKHALRLSPDSGAIMGNLANAIALQPGRLPEALELYERALALDPDLAWVHYNLAMYLADAPGRQTAALAHATRAVELEPHNPAALTLLGALYEQGGRHDAARTQWTEALRISPGYTPARQYLDRMKP